MGDLGLAPSFISLSYVLQKSSCWRGWFVHDDFKLLNTVICCCSCSCIVKPGFGCASAHRECNLFWVIEDTLITTAVYRTSSWACLNCSRDWFSFDVDIPMLSFHKCNCICIFFWLEYNTPTAWWCAQASQSFRQFGKHIDNCFLRGSSVLNLCVFIVSFRNYSFHVIFVIIIVLY